MKSNKATKEIPVSIRLQPALVPFEYILECHAFDITSEIACLDAWLTARKMRPLCPVDVLFNDDGAF